MEALRESAIINQFNKLAPEVGAQRTEQVFRTVLEQHGQRKVLDLFYLRRMLELSTEIF